MTHTPQKKKQNKTKQKTKKLKTNEISQDLNNIM